MQFLTNRYMRVPIWVWIGGVVAVATAAGLIMSNLPVHASWRYGACKVFLEHYVRFPTTISVKIGGETRNSALVGFADTNPFGSEQVRIFECYFSEKAEGQVTLSKLSMDRKALPDSVVKAYNRMLPIILSQELDTRLPKELPENLADLKED